MTELITNTTFLFVVRCCSIFWLLSINAVSCCSLLLLYIISSSSLSVWVSQIEIASFLFLPFHSIYAEPTKEISIVCKLHTNWFFSCEYIVGTHMRFGEILTRSKKESSVLPRRPRYCYFSSLWVCFASLILISYGKKDCGIMLPSNKHNVFSTFVARASDFFGTNTFNSGTAEL